VGPRPLAYTDMHTIRLMLTTPLVLVVLMLP
jgi:hypothetical protein